MEYEIELYFDDKKKGYYFIKRFSIACSFCKEEIKNIIYHSVIWNKKSSQLLRYCAKCANESKKQDGVVKEGMWAVIMTEPPKGSRPVFIRPPVLTNSNQTSVYDAAKLESVKTIDKTVYSGMPSLEGAKIGKDMELEMQRKDTPVRKPEIAGEILMDLQKAKLAIDYDDEERKRIE